MDTIDQALVVLREKLGSFPNDLFGFARVDSRRHDGLGVDVRPALDDYFIRYQDLAESSTTNSKH